MSGNSSGVTIPHWFMRIITVCMPIIMALAAWANIELRGVRTELGAVKEDTAGLRTDVAVLNVQMEQANKTNAQVQSLRDEVRDLQRIVDKLEAQLGTK